MRSFSPLQIRRTIPLGRARWARHHLHPTLAESHMAEIMEPPTSQPAHPIEHKAVRSSRKNTCPAAQSQPRPRPPGPHSPGRPRRRRGRFSPSLQGRPDPAYPIPLQGSANSTYPAPTLIDTQADFAQSNYTLGLLTHLHTSSIPPKQQAALRQQATQTIPICSALTLYLPYTTAG